MVTQETKDAAYKFASDFFDKVVERVKATGAPDKQYEMPRIEFARMRTRTEQLDFYEIKGDIRKVALQIIDEEDRPSGPELGEEIVKRLGYDPLEKLKKYENTLSFNTTGCYDPAEHIVRLAEHRFEGNFDYDALRTLAHELLHSIQSYHTEVHKKEYNLVTIVEDKPGLDPSALAIPAVMTEFVSELSDIILCDIYGGDEHGWPQKSPSTYNMQTLRESHQHFKGIGVKESWDMVKEKYKTAVRRVFAAGKEAAMPEVEEFWELSTRFLKASAYFELVCLTDSMYHQWTSLTIAHGLFDSFSGRLDFYDDAEDMIETHLCEDIGDDLLLNSLGSLVLTKSESYGISLLAIDRARDQLKHEWPSVLVMTPDEIQERYIMPLLTELAEMREERHAVQASQEQFFPESFVEPVLLSMMPFIPLCSVG
jgi:hypothetical protein